MIEAGMEEEMQRKRRDDQGFLLLTCIFLSGCSTLVGNTVWGVGSHEIEYDKDGNKIKEKHECKSWIADVFNLSLIRGGGE